MILYTKCFDVTEIGNENTGDYKLAITSNQMNSLCCIDKSFWFYHHTCPFQCIIPSSPTEPYNA